MQRGVIQATRSWLKAPPTLVAAWTTHFGIQEAKKACLLLLKVPEGACALTCREPPPLDTSCSISLARPLSATKRMPSMVTDVSAMLVDITHLRKPSGAASNT